MENDNIIINFTAPAGSHKLTIDKNEPSILLKQVRGEDLYVRIRRFLDKEQKLDVVKITSTFQKIKIAPYASLELDAKDGKYKHQYSFNLIRGSNAELLMFHISETILNFNVSSTKSPVTFMVGQATSNFIEAQQSPAGYNLRFSLGGEFNFHKVLFVKGDTRLGGIIRNIHSKIENIKAMCPEMDVQPQVAMTKDVNFELLMKKHFRPLLGI